MRASPSGRSAFVATVAGSVFIIATLAAQQAPPRSAREPLTFFVESGAAGTGYVAGDDQLARWALDAWSRVSSGALSFRSAPERDALIRLHWTPPSATTFGEMQRIMVNGRAGAAVYVRADIGALDPELARRANQDPLWRDTIVYLTCVHELGHALGLEHTSDFRDIMFFFGYGGDIIEYFARYRRQLMTRADIARVSGVSDADMARLRARLP